MGRPDLVMREGKEKFFKLLYQVKYEKPTKAISYGIMAKRLRVKPSSLTRFLNDTFQRKYQKEFEEWIEETKRAKYFCKFIEKNGVVDIVTPYDEVQRVFGRVKRGKLKLKVFKNYVRMATEYWQHTGNKSPDEWDAMDMENFIYAKPEGSRYSYSIALRQFIPEKAKLLTFKKSEARKIPEIKADNFPKKFRDLIAYAMALAKDEDEKEQIRLILLAKASTGIRTGDRKERRELWGTKYSDETKETVSYIRIIGNKIYWHVWAKKNEKWNITTDTIPPELDNLLRMRISKLHKGDWLISISSNKALKLLAEACEKVGLPKLTLHDMRKVYVSYLVRSGIPLEVAINFNVGWKDINTAYKHYFHLGAGVLEKYKGQLNTFYGYLST